MYVLLLLLPEHSDMMIHISPPHVLVSLARQQIQ